MRRLHGCLSGPNDFDSSCVPLDEGIPLQPPTYAKEAKTDDWKDEFTAQGEPGADAFHALVRVYALWGLGAEDVPYADGSRILPEVIRGT